MTKDLIRSDIKKTKEDNIQFVNKMDALIKNIDDMDSLQLASALTNTLCGGVKLAR